MAMTIEDEHARLAIGEYVDKIERHLRVAGLAPDRARDY